MRYDLRGRPDDVGNNSRAELTRRLYQIVGQLRLMAATRKSTFVVVPPTTYVRTDANRSLL
jgi:hypothetical protein